MNFSIPLIPKIQAQPQSRGFALGRPDARIEEAKKLRNQLASYYDEASSWAMPGRQCINRVISGNEDVYDDTAVIHTPEFASRIQQGTMPNFSEWTSFTAGVMEEDPERRKQVEIALAAVNSYIFKMLNASNFASEANETFMDLAMGTGAIRIDGRAGPNPLVSRYIPVGKLLFCVGPDGLPDPIFEKRCFPLNQLKVHYPDARFPENVQNHTLAEQTFYEVWERDWSEPATERYRMSVFLADNGEVVLTEWHEGQGARPIQVVRWSKAGGQGWGRGPLFACLASMRKCNYAEKALLDHTEWQLAGIWDMEDDGVVNLDTVRLEPGTVVKRAMGSRPLASVAPTGRMEIAQFTLDNARDVIRKSLFSETLGSANQTPKSATEVQHRMAELSRTIGSPFGRILLELVIPCIIRATRVLKDMGKINMPTVDGKKIDLIATSPLAQGQRFDKLEAIDRWLGRLANALGAERFMIVIDDQKLAEETRELEGVSGNLLRSKEGQAAVLEQMAAVRGMSEQAATGQGDGGGGALPA